MIDDVDPVASDDDDLLIDFRRVTLRRGGLLTAILVLPLAIPILIFGVSAAAAATSATTPFLTPFPASTAAKAATARWKAS